MVCGHLLERRRAKISFAAELAAVEQHLRKSRIVGDGRDQAATARFPFRMRAPLASPREEDCIIQERRVMARFRL